MYSNMMTHELSAERKRSIIIILMVLHLRLADLLILENTGKVWKILENITQTFPVHLDFTTNGFVCGGQIRSQVWVEYSTI